MFEWTRERVAFMDDACRQTDFYRRLAAALRPYLRPDDRLCDAGCGLGYLSLALSPLVASVTAVERDDLALSVLRREISAQHITNLSPVLADALTYRPDKAFDVMVFCFFGSMEEILSITDRCCAGTVLVLVRDHARHRFSGKPYEPGRHSLASARQVLSERGVCFTESTMSLPFHQPFRSLAAAQRFFELYGGNEGWRERLLPSDDPEFPWYLPSRRSFALLTFHAPTGRP